MKLRLSDEVLGVLTALGADSPEIASAIVALISGKQDLGVGIVLGSNLFNLAALLGLGAVVAGQVGAAPAKTVLNGATAVGITFVAAGLIVKDLNPIAAAITTLLIIGLYMYVLATGYDWTRHFPSRWQHLLRVNSREAKHDTRGMADQHHKDRSGEKDGNTDEKSWKPALLILLGLTGIVLGSIGLINYATAIAQGWLPEAVLGTFVLASLTGLPNSFTAVRLARSGKGAAVLTETFNSNSINIVAGLLLPAVVFGESSAGSLVILDLSFLLLMTALAVLLSARSARLTRGQGVLLMALYCGFIGSWTFLFLRR